MGSLHVSCVPRRDSAPCGAQWNGGEHAVGAEVVGIHLCPLRSTPEAQSRLRLLKPSVAAATSERKEGGEKQPSFLTPCWDSSGMCCACSLQTFWGRQSPSCSQQPPSHCPSFLSFPCCLTSHCTLLPGVIASALATSSMVCEFHSDERSHSCLWSTSLTPPMKVHSLGNDGSY